MSSTLAMGKEDPEQLALHLNGKKNRIRRKDFVELSKNIQISSTVTEKIFLKYSSLMKPYEEFIATSFLPSLLKEQYIEILRERARALEL